jgi:hypothetical protein
MNDYYRALWLVIFILFSVVMGGAVSILTWRTRRNLAESILAGGTAFGGTFLITLAGYGFVDQGH